MRSFTTLRSTANYAPQEVEEHNRESELNRAPHNEKTALAFAHGQENIKF